MRDSCSERGDRRDADVRARAGCRARSGCHDHGQTDVAEHKADETARDGGREAPERYGDQEERVQALEYLR